MIKKEKNNKESLPLIEEWFLIIDNHQFGPFTTLELKKHPKFTPDTLVWKKGFKEWTKARFVPELQDLFKDEPEPQSIKDSEKRKGTGRGLAQEDPITLTLQQDPYQLMLWILLILVIIFYLYFYHNQA